MKQLPIRWKLTLWFTTALVLVSLFTLFIVVRLSDRILQKTIRDNLIETVENNVDEVEFYTDPAGRNDIDYYLLYGDGYLEIDDDFLNQVNQVYTALYDADLKGAAAIVIGSEGDGMTRLAAENCDFLVSIPMKGDLNSLNASASAAILLYEAVRQRMN